MIHLDVLTGILIIIKKTHSLYIFLNYCLFQMLAVTEANIVHFKVLIFDEAFKHFKWYLSNDGGNNGFQFLNCNQCCQVLKAVDTQPKKL